LHYLHYLENARLINSLSAAGRRISVLQKPDKIYLENTNLLYALSPDNVDKGALREAYFMNQLSNTKYEIALPLKGDFLIDDKYTFEIGGKNKTSKQLANIPNSFVAMDDIEAGIGNKIPLWLFGML
jgi:predicted AAA+ superfamily ATPase